MRVKFTSRDRAAAIRFCSILACTPGATWIPFQDSGTSQKAFDLWWAAVADVRRINGAEDGLDIDSAEAEAHLRCGWSP